MSQANSPANGHEVPGVDLEDLSREQLIDLARLYARLFFAMDGLWYLALMESFDEDTATELDLRVWGKYARYEAKRLLPLMNIPNDDLSEFPRAFALSPWFSQLKHVFTKEDNNTLTLTVLDCPSMEAMKREGSGREKTFCSQVEPQLLQMIVQAFHPRAKAYPVDLPLKETPDGICCRWRFVIED